MSGTNSIWRTPWGSYIDLARLVSVGPVLYRDGSVCAGEVYVEMVIAGDTVVYPRRFNRSSVYVQEVVKEVQAQVDQVIIAWRAYKGETNPTSL